MSENTSLRMELDSVRERYRALKAEFVEHENRFEVYLDRLYDLERWRESEMARRVSRASSPIDLTGDPDSDDDTLGANPYLPTGYMLSIWWVLKQNTQHGPTGSILITF